MRTAIVLSAAATLLAASAITVSVVASATPARHPSSATHAVRHQSSAGQSVHRTVVEHAITDTVADTGPKGDSLGDVLAFANPVFGPKNRFRVGSDNGSCVRTKVGAAYECTWTTTFRHGSIVVTGPFYDAADSVLAVTGGTGYWRGVTGQMGLHARNAEGTAYDFRFTLRRPWSMTAVGVVPAPGVVVLGMHRSGTSGVTHALSTLDMVGVDDPIGGDWSNPEGHWESWRLVEMNNRVLAAAGARWDDPRTVTDHDVHPQLSSDARTTLDEVLPREPWLWKDPRLSFTLPFWRGVLRDAGRADPAVVLCLRNPLEVAASLERRNGFSRRQGLELWERYTEACLDNLTGLAVFVSHYEDFVSSQSTWWREVTEFLDQQLGIDSGAAEVTARGTSIARPDLRRHRFVPADVHGDENVSAEQRALYTLTGALRSSAQFQRPVQSEPAPLPALPLERDVPLAVWIAGFPSRYGGADTELDHIIDLFLMHDVEVNLVPNWPPPDSMVRSVLARGARIHDYVPAIFADRVVLSFCNGEFLKRLPEIEAAGRPARVIWFNCMTWTFEAELEAHANGWIDYFGFESVYQREYLGPQIEAVAPYRTFGYRPFFDVRRVAWEHRDYGGSYRVGRISRDDGFKYAEDTWRIFDRVLVPREVTKKVYILGYGPNAAAKIGAPPDGMDWLTWSPDAITSTEFYRTVDTLIHKTGGSRESYGRVVVEAYAHGVVPIVEDAFAFGELVVAGETGFRGASSDEMSHYASLLAFDSSLHKSMAAAGRDLLVSLSDPGDCFAPWLEVL